MCDCNIHTEAYVKVWMMMFEPGGQQKESFGSDREKLSVVAGGVGAQKSFASGLQTGPQSRKLGGHNLPPAAGLLAITQDRGAIGVAVQEIQLMGKFMDDEIASAGTFKPAKAKAAKRKK